MQATFTKSDFYNIKESAYKARCHQALILQYSILAETENGLHEPVIARLYASLRRCTRGITCILWVDGCHNVAASGFASGDDYHHRKFCAALADAIRNAGIDLTDGSFINGDGDMREALLAIARADCPDARILGVFEAYN